MKPINCDKMIQSMILTIRARLRQKVGLHCNLVVQENFVNKINLTRIMIIRESVKIDLR